MKKVLSVVLALAMVLAVASFAAAATLSYTGNVNIEFNNNHYFNDGGYGDTWLTIDYTKDLTEGWSAGAKFKVVPGKKTDGYDRNYDDATFQNADAIAFDGQGFVKYDAELWNVSFKTGTDAVVGSDLGGPDVGIQGKLSGGPDVEFEVKPIEGLTGTLVVSSSVVAGTATTKQQLNYLVKGVYSLDAITAGVGYSVDSLATETSDDNVSVMGVWGTYKVLDALTVGAEYQSRKLTNLLDAFAGYKVKANYAQDAIAANFAYTVRSAGVFTKNDKEAEAFSLADRFMDDNPGWTNPLTSVTDTHYLISVDGSYALTDAVKVGAAFNTTDAKFSGTKLDGKTAVTDATSDFKVYVSDTLVPNLVLEAGYQQFIDSKIYVKLQANIGG